MIRLARTAVVIAADRRYVFRYLDGDDNWCDDETMTPFEDNGFGRLNAIIDLTEKP